MSDFDKFEEFKLRYDKLFDDFWKFTDKQREILQQGLTCVHPQMLQDIWQLLFDTQNKYNHLLEKWGK